MRVFFLSARPALAAATLVLTGLSAAPARAENARIESAAQQALDKAQNDYLNMNYGAGATRLEKALKACGANRCAPGTRAALLRDAGTMLFRKGDTKRATKMWANAVKVQPGLELNPAYDTPDLRSAFAQATGGSAVAASGAPGGGGGQAEASQPTGEFDHTPAAEQAANTPLPIYATGGADGVVQVVAKYKGAAMSEWKRLDLKRMAGGWGGLIPCGDVATGTMRYLLEGLDSSGQTVANSGSVKHPYTVPIKDQIAGESPHLPGKAPPKVCGGASVDNDCPPDFPGCNGAAAPAGASGDDGRDDSDRDDAKDEEEDRKEPANTPRHRHLWLGAEVGIDFVSFPSGPDLCRLDPNTALPGNSDNIYCTNRDGTTDFPSRTDGGALNGVLQPGMAGGSGGGLVHGNERLMLALDYALTGNLMIGARGGVIFSPYRGQAAIDDGRAPDLGRLYLDMRVTWVFGRAPIWQTGLAPMVFVGGGIQQFAAETTSSVITLATRPPQSGTADLWQVDGPGFVMAGGGVRWAVAPAFALTAALRLNAAFGDNGLMPTFGPEIGGQVGF